MYKYYDICLICLHLCCDVCLVCVSSFAVTDLTGDKEALPQPHLSFAEELRLLASTATEETSTSDVEHLRQV